MTGYAAAVAAHFADAPPSTSAGIITSVASVTTALALLLTSIGVVVPQLRKLRKTGEANGRKLDTIHVLVNSTLTNALEAELEATRQHLRALEEVQDMKRERGVEDAMTTAAMAAARAKVSHLTQQLADRGLAEQLLADQGLPQT